MSPLIGGGGGLLQDHFDSKQYSESVDQPSNCHPSLGHITFAFRSSEVRRLSSDLDLYGVTDKLGMFPLFLNDKANLLSDHFDRNQSRESVDLPRYCHPSLGHITFAFRSSEVRRLSSGLALMKALTHWACFLFFLAVLKRTADVTHRERCSNCN